MIACRSIVDMDFLYLTQMFALIHQFSPAARSRSLTHSKHR
jgi:hypothetical protein